MRNAIAGWLFVWSSFAMWGTAAHAQDADAVNAMPLDRNARVLMSQTFVVGADGATGSSLFVPNRGFFDVDFSVQPGKQLTLVLLTDEQWNEANTGRRVEGQPLMRAPIDGTASQEIQIERGTYHLVFLNKFEGKETSTTVVMRASFRAF